MRTSPMVSLHHTLSLSTLITLLRRGLGEAIAEDLFGPPTGTLTAQTHTHTPAELPHCHAPFADDPRRGNPREAERGAAD